MSLQQLARASIEWQRCFSAMRADASVACIPLAGGAQVWSLLAFIRCRDWIL
jgi:hypothetical protein